MFHPDLVVTKSIEISASPDRVWKTLTDPDLIKEYLFGTETLTNWKVGSNIIFQGEYQGAAYMDKGIVLENILHQKIKYSYWSSFSGLQDLPENYAKITYNFESNSLGGTKFTWTQEGYSSMEGMEHSKNGMEDFLNTIKMIAEQK